MKTAVQKKAKEVLNNMKSFILVRLDQNSNKSHYRVRINGEAYVTVGSFNGIDLQKLKRYAKDNGWTPLDLFPASVYGSDYGGYTHLVRLKALTQNKDKLKIKILDPFYDNQFEKNIKLAESRWPTKEEDYHMEDYVLTVDEAQKLTSQWKEYKKLIYTKEEDIEPDVETCIKVLKKHGYKIQKPVTTYEEI